MRQACDKLGLVKATYTIENCAKLADATKQIVNQDPCSKGERKLSLDLEVTSLD